MILCPNGQPGDAFQVPLETPAGVSAAFSTNMLAANPALLPVEGSTQGRIFHAGTTRLASVQDVKNAGEPAQPGELLEIHATGLDSSLPLFVNIGGVPADVKSVAPSAGEAGVWTILVKVPPASATGTAVPVLVEVTSPDGHQLTSKPVTIAVEPVRQ
jgi:uncharacterized protein (TIGR03437 family)